MQRYPAYQPYDISGWSLERVQSLLNKLDEPQQAYPAILITGTKGKGSTAAMFESILRAAGRRTGLYTSPYLHSFRESIQLDGALIEEQLLVEALEAIEPALVAAPGLTRFELQTTLAFVVLARARVEVGVIEVGLGGRRDATNVVDPLVSVITPISYDHTHILGETLTEIAREKAGIIRSGGCVVSASQVEEVRAVIRQLCQDLGAELVFAEQPWQVDEARLDGQTFSLEGEVYHLPLLGRHQIGNALTALAAAACLAEQVGWQVPLAACQLGLAQVKWPGRFEILAWQPLLLVDGAMNGESIRTLIEALRLYFADRPLNFIFGASADHPVTDMLAALLPIAKRVWVTAAHERAESPTNLANIAAQLGGPVIVTDNPLQALEAAQEAVGLEEIICVTGSLFLVAAVREIWFARTGQALLVDPRI
jgi:dihydrofolate synthase/folylpolyglutamate synthase